MQPELLAQSKWGFENYNYLEHPGTNTIVPVLHLETPGKLYGELRYNYEAKKTLTVLGGKTFRNRGGLSVSLTPLLGYSAGDFNGLTFAAHVELEWKKIYFSSQTQQSLPTKQGSQAFFFSWSESGYAVTDHFFGGVAMQYTAAKDGRNFEPGIVAGLSLERFSFPCYLFNPLRKDMHIILGLNYAWSFKKKDRS